MASARGSRWAVPLAWTRYTAELGLPVEVLQDNNEGRVELHRKPIGVVGSITPWNWPVMIACWHIIPAIRAGNTVVIKPSPIDAAVHDPPGRDHERGAAAGRGQRRSRARTTIGAAMSAHPGIAKMSFTGSTATGKKIMAVGRRRR